MMDNPKIKKTLDMAAAIRGRFAPLGGVELNIPVREPILAPATVATRNARHFEGCGTEIIDPWAFL